MSKVREGTDKVSFTPGEERERAIHLSPRRGGGKEGSIPAKIDLS